MFNLQRLFQASGARRRADGTLLLVTVVWGAATPLLHTLTQQYPPLSLLMVRFGFAALGMALIVRRGRQSATRLDRRGWLIAVILGAVLYLAFAAHTLGLQHTTVAHGSLLTGLNVVCVPMLARFLLRQRVRLRTVAGLILTVLGLALLANDGRLWGTTNSMYAGDPLMLLCAVAFALHVVLVTALARHLPPLQLNQAQMIVVAVLAVPPALVVDGLVWPSAGAWSGAALLGLVASALAFTGQLAAQRHTTPTRAACIFALEPVFAIGVAACAGEAISSATFQGGSLLLLGIIVAETLPEVRLASICGLGTKLGRLPLALGTHRVIGCLQTDDRVLTNIGTRATGSGTDGSGMLANSMS